MNKVKKPFYKKWWVWLIAIVLIIGIGGNLSGKDSSGSTSDKTSQTKTVKSTTKSLKKTIQKAASKAKTAVANSSSSSNQVNFNVGQTFNQKGVQITVEESDIPNTDGWLSGPDIGKEFVANKVKIVNNSNKQVDFNMFNWEFFDNGTQVNDITVAMDANGNDPYKPDFSSGKIDPKATFEGWLVYQGTPNVKHQLRYTASFWFGRTINFNVK